MNIQGKTKNYYLIIKIVIFSIFSIYMIHLIFFDKDDYGAETVSNEIKKSEKPNDSLWLPQSSANQREGNFRRCKIRSKVWMAENLNVDLFSDGRVINKAISISDWLKYLKAKKPCWCYFEFDSLKYSSFGKIYNWFAVIDSGLPPKDYRIPTDYDWKQLELAIGLSAEDVEVYNRADRGGDRGGIYAFKLKSASGWSNAMNGNNKTRFTLKPGGYLRAFGLNKGFDEVENGFWWTSTVQKISLIDNVWSRSMLNTDHRIIRNTVPIANGMYIRCVKIN
jgi:uncharacterized protein (TIGR02145 family)